MTWIERSADDYDVKEALARVLYSHKFSRWKPEGRLLNFKVKLNRDLTRGVRNDGTGTLLLPAAEVGRELLRLVRTKGLQIKAGSGKNKIFFKDAQTDPSEIQGQVEALRKIPYQDPSFERKRDLKLKELGAGSTGSTFPSFTSLRIDKLQFGIWDRRPDPTTDPEQVGIFCWEWQKEYTSIGNGLIWIEYDRKLIRIQLGNSALDATAQNVVITFSNIRNIWTGYDCGANRL